MVFASSARETVAEDVVRPAVPARVGRRLAQAGTYAPTTPIRLTPGGHRLARMTHPITALHAIDAHLTRSVATQRGTTRDLRATGRAHQGHGSSPSLLTGRHRDRDPAAEGETLDTLREETARATATPERADPVHLAVDVADPASEPTSPVFSGAGNAPRQQPMQLEPRRDALRCRLQTGQARRDHIIRPRQVCSTEQGRQQREGDRYDPARPLDRHGAPRSGRYCAASCRLPWLSTADSLTSKRMSFRANGRPNLAWEGHQP